ncbi:MAG: hypothetical protein KAW17_05970, partial [Candidatus Eisenbacteria sp.]|nr:hypothetical protein [Candidatus Eisenbacteria bacterium]
MSLSRRDLLVAIGSGIAVVLGTCEVLGFIGLGGGWVGIGILAVGLVVGLAKLWLLHRAQRCCPEILSPRGFAFQTPPWLPDHEKTVTTEMAKAAFLLLAFDRTATGCWGKTYLYRRVRSGSGIPRAGGSLGGTPLALAAIASCSHQSDFRLRRWALHPLFQTLAKVLTNDGSYLRGATFGEMGRVPLFEPLRHAAGGCLIKLMFGDPDTRDIRTLRILCGSHLDPMAWDHAMVCRVLLQAHFTSLPRKIRRLALARHRAVLEELLARAENAPVAARIWADSYEYGVDVNTQWAAVWALLPCLLVPGTPRELSDRLDKTIRRFLLAYSSTTADESLLPSRVGKDGRGSGSHVFATAMGVVAWRVLELHNTGTATHARIDAAQQTLRMLRRLTGCWPGVIESPSKATAADPLTTEGYFAWAGLCLASTSLGARIAEDDCRKAVGIAKEFHECADESLSSNALFERFEDLIL